MRVQNFLTEIFVRISADFFPDIFIISLLSLILLNIFYLFQKKITMRLTRELPQIEKKISTGELSLTNAAKAKEFFSQEEKTVDLSARQKLEVLETLENKSTREAEKILLAQSSSPAPEVKESIHQVNALVAEFKFAADKKLLKKLEHLRGLLAHKSPCLKTSKLIDA